MIIKDNITTIVTHANCPDGKASALILKKVYPNAKVIFLIHNSKEYLELEPQPGIIFCDFSPHPTTVQKFVDAGSYVLDHHKHAKDVVEAFGEHGVFADEVLEPGVSGAVLAFREVYVPALGTNDELNRFVTLVGIRDCWVSSSPLFREACEQSSALHFYNEEYFLEKGGLVESDYALGKYLYANDLKRAQKIAEKKLIIHDSIGLMAGTNTSDVAGYAFDLHGVEILAGFKIDIEDGKANVIVSMRSRGTIDVGKIAKENGGGGHKNAAGFSFDLDECAKGCGDIVDFVFGKIVQHIHYVGPDWIKVGAVLREKSSGRELEVIRMVDGHNSKMSGVWFSNQMVRQMVEIENDWELVEV